MNWQPVAYRVRTTIQALEDDQRYDAPLIHLATVYGVLSVAYYAYDRPLASDATYDLLCRFLLANYDKAIAQGTYGTILRHDMLSAGSGYHFADIESLPYSARTCHDIYLLTR